MATINDGELYLEISNAGEEQLRRGLAAARGALDAAEVEIEQAATAAATLGGNIEANELNLSREEARHAGIWLEAQQAALDASQVDWRKCERARLGSWSLEQQCRAEMERIMAKEPHKELVPPLDPGPHFTVEPFPALLR